MEGSDDPILSIELEVYDGRQDRIALDSGLIHT